MNKSHRLTQAVIVGALLLVVNLLAHDYFFRWDLTDDARYTLSDVSRRTADTLDRIMTVQVYLEGDLPPAVKRYRDATLTFLMEMKAHAGSRLQYRFIDPSDNPALQNELRQKGVEPIPLTVKGKGEVSKKYIYPAAVVRYDGKEEVVDLLKSDCEFFPNGVYCDYAKAEAEIEYKLVSHMRRLFRRQRRIVAFLTGHKEWPLKYMKDFVEELQKFYEVVEVSVRDGSALRNSKHFLPDSLKRLIKEDGIDVLIVAQPDTLFTAREKYEIDQFIMRGGRVLWLMDMVRVDEEDFRTPNAATMSRPRDVNLNELFLKYGFKINTDLVQDDFAGLIDATFMHDNRPVMQKFKWVFYPRVSFFGKHPICRNLDDVILRYASSLDTVPVARVEKQVIFTSSPASRSTGGQIVIDFAETISQPPPLQVYQGKGRRIMALALSGYFPSAFEGRDAPTDEFAPRPPTAKFFPRAPLPTKMVVVADGDVVLKDHSPGSKGAMLADNKTLLMNAVEYLVEDESLNSIRARDVVIRRLDYKKVKGNEGLIRATVVLAPIVLVALFGIVRKAVRDRKHKNLKQA
ncbi:MAG: gliding motility-associated ABC transporter substrate-binding protein GldG [Bacteroidia bacterium]|nr:gliding motility-associated ABC transporter substrate-binding protein GldG [Bacteroidia bacterium]MDW8333387.1 gliding motility-associated ABC transporter substrate-binding protein GldG [Bacteroidia bacterium]